MVILRIKMFITPRPDPLEDIAYALLDKPGELLDEYPKGYYAELVYVSRDLTVGLIEELSSGKFNVDSLYEQHLKTYLAALGDEPTKIKSISDAEDAARHLRSLFSRDAEGLSPAFSAVLDVMLVQHVGLRACHVVRNASAERNDSKQKLPNPDRAP
jgi:hypothetical protein